MPSFIYIAAIGSMFSIRLERSTDKEFEKIERNLFEISEKSTIEKYFKSRFDTLLSKLEQISEKSSAEKIEHEIKLFSENFPDKLFELFVFNKDLKVLNNHELASEAAFIISKTSEDLLTPLSLNQTEKNSLFRLLTNPLFALKNLRGPKGRMVFLGEIGNSSWGYINLKNNFGILAFLNKSRLPRDFILKKVLNDFQSENLSFGYSFLSGEIGLPTGMDKSFTQKIIKSFELGHSERFFDEENLILLNRLDQNSILIGTSKQPDFEWNGLLVFLFIYCFGSFIFIKHSYKKEILNQQIPLSLKYRFPGYFAFSFGFFFFSTIGISYLFYLEKIEDYKAENNSQITKILTEIDKGFEAFLEERLNLYKQLTKKMDHSALNLPFIKKILIKCFDKGFFDNLYFLSSESVRLSSTTTFPTELRRNLFTSGPEKGSQVESLFERGYDPTPFQLDLYKKCSIDPGSFSEQILFGNINLPPERFEKLLNTFVNKTGVEAMKIFNSSKGLSSSLKENLLNLTMDSLFEEETREFMLASQNKRDEFMLTETNRDYWLSYFHIIPGPDGKAWYFIFLFHNFPTLEHQYLEKIFQKIPDSLKNGKLYAVSASKRTQNFPKIFEYRKFEKTLTKLSQFKTSLNESVSLENEEQELSAMKCSSLKNYVLIFLQPANFFEQKAFHFGIYLLTALLTLGIFGFLLASVLLERLVFPFVSVFSGIKKLEKKDFSIRLSIPFNNELGKLGSAFNKAVALLEDMEIAKVIQSDLFPAYFINQDNFTIHAINKMCQSLGGDYYDYFTIDNGKIAIILGDVSGHGISAALVAGMAKAAFCVLIPKYPLDPDIVLDKINLLFFNLLNKKKMMTCFLGILDSKSGNFVFSNAGQSYPIQIYDEKNPELCKLPSNPLGIRKKAAFQKTESDISNSSILLYSDGVVEAANRENQMFDYERLLETVKKNSSMEGIALLNKIIEETEKFTGKNSFEDDLTMLIISSKKGGIPKISST
ncbi:MAG: SpoIIE family protein phosphatase [Candidatus Riflebacteria bacterium]|nr:SpoIIE family protein phosphatase [Candidatus Riflebacteria bacterium]